MIEKRRDGGEWPVSDAKRSGKEISSVASFVGPEDR